MKSISSFAVEAGRLLLPLLILGAGIGGFVVFGQRPEVPVRPPRGDTRALVETVAAKSFDGTITLEVEGVSVPYRTVALAAEVAGRITEKAAAARSGSFIDDGDFLFQIDRSDYEIEVERLRALVDQSNQEIAAADTDISSANKLIRLGVEEVALRQKDLDRLDRLLQRDAGSQSDRDESQRMELAARIALQTLRNQLAGHIQRKNTLEAALRLASAQLKKAELDLQRTRVTAPAPGTVIADLVEQDDYVQRGDILLHINDSSHAEVKCSLKVDELLWVWIGGFGSEGPADLKSRMEIPATPVEVSYEFEGTRYIWDGVLSRYEGTGLDEQTRTIPCRVLVENPTQLRVDRSRDFTVVPPTLFSGMYVTIRIDIDPDIPLVEIPTSALRPGSQVWRVDEGRLQIHQVDVVSVRGSRVLLRNTNERGIQPADKVITSPLAAVQDGIAVQLSEEGSP